MITHSVYFYLSDEPDAREKLIEGLEKMRPIESVASFRLATPAATTERPVIDNAYGVAAHCDFATIADHDAYQIHPLHVEFIDTCKHLWSDVKIFDSEF